MGKRPETRNEWVSGRLSSVAGAGLASRALTAMRHGGRKP